MSSRNERIEYRISWWETVKSLAFGEGVKQMCDRMIERLKEQEAREHD